MDILFSFFRLLSPTFAISTSFLDTFARRRLAQRPYNLNLAVSSSPTADIVFLHLFRFAPKFHFFKMRPTVSILRVAMALTSVAPIVSAWPHWLPEVDALVVRADDPPGKFQLHKLLQRPLLTI